MIKTIFTTYDEDFQVELSYTDNEMRNRIYVEDIDHEEYETYDVWITDMIKSGVYYATTVIAMTVESAIGILMHNDENASWYECTTEEEIIDGIKSALDNYDKSEESYGFLRSIYIQMPTT